MIQKAPSPSSPPMAETQPHHRPLLPPLFIKLLLIPTATAAAMIISQYYFPFSWNNRIMDSFHVSATLESMRRLIESPPLVYLLFNLIVVSIVVSNTFSFHFSLALSKRTTSSPAAAPVLAPISDTGVEIEAISTPITTPFPSPDHHRSPKTASLLEEKEIAVEEWVGPEEEEGGGGGDSMEDTWRAIVEGKERAQTTRQLRKSDTWSARSSRAKHVDGGRVFKKSETFRERGRVEEEEMEEVDRRAEAFISMIRGDIWLQRKESDQRLHDFINRGL